jgi:hypothetical protein
MTREGVIAVFADVQRGIARDPSKSLPSMSRLPGDHTVKPVRAATVHLLVQRRRKAKDGLDILLADYESANRRDNRSRRRPHHGMLGL